MSDTFMQLRALSIGGYIFQYGAILGYITTKYTVNIQANGTVTHQSIVLLWVGFSVVGSTMLAIKDRNIRNEQMRRRLTVTDVLMTILLLVIALNGFLSSFIQETAFLLIILPYIYFYMAFIYRHADEL